jgi:hypothetical protein
MLAPPTLLERGGDSSQWEFQGRVGAESGDRNQRRSRETWALATCAAEPGRPASSVATPAAIDISDITNNTNASNREVLIGGATTYPAEAMPHTMNPTGL